jgi:hypothetical protein
MRMSFRVLAAHGASKETKMQKYNKQAKWGGVEPGLSYAKSQNNGLWLT